MNSKRLWLILQHEYTTRVAKKSFIILTLLMPLLMIALGSVPAVMALMNSGDEKNVIVIDETNKYGSKLESNGEFTFAEPLPIGSDPRKVYNDTPSEIYAVVLIPRNIEKNCRVSIYSPNAVSMEFKNHIRRQLEKEIHEARIESYGIDGLKEIIKQCDVDLDTRNIVWSKEGDENESSTEIAMVIGMVLSLVIYFFVLMYGSMIMNSVIEEKTNRIVEVIVSSCRPIELLLGKIIAVALVGFTQIIVWAVLISAGSLIVGMSVMPDLSQSAELAAAAGGNAPEMSDFAEIYTAIMGVNYLRIFGYFILYFIGGYVLFASLFAGLASAVDEASDASQFVTPVTIIIILALYAGLGCMENPDGNLALWCSMIPFSSPIVMMVRLPFDVPVWQMILSLALLYASAGIILYFSAQIYRRGILMYGKKLKFKDIIKWIHI